MKNLIAFLMYCLSVTALIAQNQENSDLKLIRSTADETVLELQIGGLTRIPVETSAGTAELIGFQGGTPLLQAGAPDLPKFATALRIPATGNMAVEVLDGDFQEYANVLVAPSKGNLLRTTDPATVPYTFGSLYEHDQFFPNNLAGLQKPYIMRDARGQALWIYPVQYNPVTKVLRVYNSLTLRIYRTNLAGENELRNAPKSQSRAFGQIYNKMFVNNSAFAVAERSANNIDPERMLVITNDAFLADLEPLVRWKREMGIHTTVVPISQIGASDAASVFNFVKNYYNDYGISYLLLVGDETTINPEMRLSSGTPYSCDNCFGYMEGDDHLPEIMVGRFNAVTLDHVKLMVARNLDYEKTPLVDSLNNWTATAMASASNEGAGIGDDGQADWQQGNGWKSAHLADGYEKVWEFYDGNHSADSPTPGDESADKPGNPVFPDLVQLMNTRGVSLYNYCGHGWEQGLVSGNFNTTAVANLRNTHRYPILVAVACCAGNFTNNGGGDCLGEAWQRAGDPANNEPWGGIGGFFSSDFQSWAPPMEGQDGMNQYLVDADGIYLTPSIGGMAVYGNGLMIAAYANGGEVMADFWNPFHDPTTMPRTRMAQSLTATHANALFIGASSLSVSCPVEGALVSLYWQDQTLAVATVEDGVATLEFPALDNVGDLIVTATQFNYKPYQATVTVAPSTGPFVVNQLIELDDPSGNQNQLADYGENLVYNLIFSNVGVETATGVTATLSTTDDKVTITDASEDLGNIGVNESLNATAAFAFTVNNYVENGHLVSFNLHVTFNDTMGYDQTLNVPLRAPVLAATTISIDDTQGNNNKRFDSGETVLVTVRNANTGSSATTNAVGVLTSDCPWLSISPAVNLGTLDAGSTAIDAVFQVTVDPAAPQVVTAHFQYALQASPYEALAEYGPYIVNAVIENFESHTFTQFPWQSAGDKPWAISTYQSYSGGYCSRSGTITHNQKSKMSLTMDVTSTGDIYFARRTSCEADFDFLRFFIDSVEVAAWTGEQYWAEVSFPVTPGVHTFTWSYEKDAIGSSGFDRAWVDEIILPPHEVFVESHTLESNNDFLARVSPNPSADRAVLYLQTPADQRLQIDVYDSFGRRVRTLQPATRSVQGPAQFPIELLDQAPGLYYIHIRLDESSRVLKFVKM